MRSVRDFSMESPRDQNLLRLRLRFLAPLTEESREQQTHRLDRLNSGEREIAEDEGRISEGRKFVGFALVRFDTFGHRTARDRAPEVRAIDPGLLRDRVEHGL